MRALVCAGAMLAWTVAVCGGALPRVGDPHRLVDLRWLARPLEGRLFLVDTFSQPATPRKQGRSYVVADVTGPGVLRHLMVTPRGTLTIEADGKTVWQGEPIARWPRVYVPPKPNQRGTVPFAFPMVQTAWVVGHLAVPIPFGKRLRLLSDRADRALWAAGRRLDRAPPVAMTDATYRHGMAEAFEHLNGFAYDLYPVEGSRELAVEAYCPATDRTCLVKLPGSGEVVGFHLRADPSALSLLRQLVVEITPDGHRRPTVAMPLVDLVGASHPWPNAWSYMVGDPVAGLTQGVYRNRLGRQQAHVRFYLKLPMPFAKGLRIEVWNRSRDLPVTLRGRLRVAELTADQAARLPRLCGTSRRLDLPRPTGQTDLLTLPGTGHLVGLSVFTTGHGRASAWRQRYRIALLGPDGAAVAAGPGLVPLAQWSGSPMFAALTWNQNSLQSTGLAGAARHFWLDPLPIRDGSRIRYTAGGPGGPKRAEVGALWYQMPPGPGKPVAYRAPAQPDDVEPVPPPHHGMLRATEPGGWSVEAETLAKVAMASHGAVRAETVGAMDAFASGGAYLAWNAQRPGAVLDLLVPTPPTAYIRIWYHRLQFPSGASFRIELRAPDGGDTTPTWQKDDAGIRSRVLGSVNAPCRIDSYGPWPWRQAYRTTLPPLRNPCPGRVVRLRFTCVTKRSSARAYLLAVDQLGMVPCDVPPAGWQEMESAPVIDHDLSVTAGLVPVGSDQWYGWGARRVAASGPGRARIGLVRVLAGPPVAAVEVRGRVEAGRWQLRAGTGQPVDLVGPEPPGKRARKGRRAPRQKPAQPVVWTVPLSTARAGPRHVLLDARCLSANGVLVLDAWRFVPGNKP